MVLSTLSRRVSGSSSRVTPSGRSDGLYASYRWSDMPPAREGTSWTRKFIRKTQTAETYPMHVMRICAFLERYGSGERRLESHQRLKRLGLVTKLPTVQTENVLFISHEWVGYMHCDPDGAQTRELCMFLRRLQSGEIASVESSWEYQLAHSSKEAVTAAEWVTRLEGAYIWLDYICVPQPHAIDTEDDAFVLSRAAGSASEGILTPSPSQPAAPGRTRRPAGQVHIAAEELATSPPVMRGPLDSMQEPTGELPGSDDGSALMEVSDHFIKSLSSSCASEPSDVRVPATLQQVDEASCEVSRVASSEGEVSRVTTSEVSQVSHSDGRFSVSAAAQRMRQAAGVQSHEELVEACSRAIASIPAYIERSNFLVVFAPNTVHVDRQSGSSCSALTWRARGWCRTEFIGALLAHRCEAFILVTSGTGTPHFIFPADAVGRLLPGHGKFTCCTLNHMYDGKPIPCDKLSIRGVLEKLLAGRMNEMLTAGKLVEYRFFVVSQLHFMQGLPEPNPTSAACLTCEGSEGIPYGGVNTGRLRSVDENPSITQLKIRLKWTDSDDRNGELSGWNLLKYASIEGDVAAVRGLLAHSAEMTKAMRQRYIDAPLSKSAALPNLSVPHGATTLILTAWIGNASHLREVLTMLLDAGANEHAVDGIHESDALAWAAGFGRLDALNFFLERRAQASHLIKTEKQVGPRPLAAQRLVAAPAWARHVLIRRDRPPPRTVVVWYDAASTRVLVRTTSHSSASGSRAARARRQHHGNRSLRPNDAAVLRSQQPVRPCRAERSDHAYSGCGDECRLSQRSEKPGLEALHDGDDAKVPHGVAQPPCHVHGYAQAAHPAHGSCHPRRCIGRSHAPRRRCRSEQAQRGRTERPGHLEGIWTLSGCRGAAADSRSPRYRQVSLVVRWMNREWESSKYCLVLSASAC